MPNVYGGFVFDFSLLHNSRYIEKSALGFAENIVRTGAIWRIRGLKSYLTSETEQNSS